MKAIRLEGFTASGRVATMAAVKEAIGRAGWLLDSAVFSNKAVSFSFEIPAQRLPGLVGGLAAAGVVLRPWSAPAGGQGDSGSVLVSLHIIFMHDGTDMRMEVPPIPG
jgi:hypothetical protein